jgi:transcription elongation regulator 1
LIVSTQTLLTEKNPSPLAPFSSVMPLLITDPRYVLLPSQVDRETAFNEWCKEVARRARLAKSSATADASGLESYIGDEASAAKLLSKEEEKAAARAIYDNLLSSEVTSTRTTWDEFRRKWKKDRRFFGFGRDDREREKVFRAWLKDLGERENGDQLESESSLLIRDDMHLGKRAQARKAELDFMELLKSTASKIPITPNSQWKDVRIELPCSRCTRRE